MRLSIGCHRRPLWSLGSTLLGLLAVGIIPCFGRSALPVADKPTQDPGDLYVANIRSNRVTVYDGATGSFEGVFVDGEGGLNGPTGIAFGPDGHLYVASSQSNQILRYDGATGAPLGAFVDDSALAMPFSIVFGPDGDLYVSSGRGNALLRYDGRTVGLAFTADGRLFVGDFGGSRLFLVPPDGGEPRLVETEGLDGPENIAVKAR